MNIDQLEAISPLDGRYAQKCDELRGIFSEYGLVKRRIRVECAWLAALCEEPGIRECKPLEAAEKALLDSIAGGTTVADAAEVKEIEKTTNHDVKAVEYFLKRKMAGTPLESTR